MAVKRADGRPPTWRTWLARRASRARSCRSSCATARRSARTAARACCAAAEQLGYRPNAMARSLASRRTQTVGVLLNDLHNPFFAEIADGLETLAAGARLPRPADHRRPPRRGASARCSTALLEYRTDGIILVSPADAHGRRARRDRLDADRDRRPPAARRRASTRSSSTRRPARGSPSQHLAELGHERILHIDGGRGAGAAPRRAGYERAMRALGWREHAVVVPGDFTEEAGVRAAEALLARRRPLPTACSPPTTSSPPGVLDRLEDAGVRGARGRLDRRLRQHVPRRAAPHVADDGRPAAARDGPARAAAAARADRRAHGAASVRLMEPRLVVRKTSGPAPVSRARRSRCARGRAARGRRDRAARPAAAPARRRRRDGRRRSARASRPGSPSRPGACVTVAHAARRRPIAVRGAGGVALRATVLRRDDGLDLALLAVPGLRPRGAAGARPGSRILVRRDGGATSLAGTRRPPRRRPRPRGRRPALARRPALELRATVARRRLRRARAARRARRRHRLRPLARAGRGGVGGGWRPRCVRSCGR